MTNRIRAAQKRKQNDLLTGLTNTVGNAARGVAEAAYRFHKHGEARIAGASQELNRVAPEKRNASHIPIGTKRGDGKVWSGESYGWQSPASHKSLSQRGEFRMGEIAGRRIMSDIGRGIDPAVKAAAGKAAKAVTNEATYRYNTAPKPVQAAVRAVGGGIKNIDAGLEAVSRVTNTSRLITDEATIGALTFGGAKALKALKGASKVDDAVAVTRQARGAGVQNRIQRRLEQANARRLQQELGSVGDGIPVPPRKPVQPPQRPSSMVPQSSLEAPYKKVENLRRDGLPNSEGRYGSPIPMWAKFDPDKPSRRNLPSQLPDDLKAQLSALEPRVPVKPVRLAAPKPKGTPVLNGEVTRIRDRVNFSRGAEGRSANPVKVTMKPPITRDKAMPLNPTIPADYNERYSDVGRALMQREDIRKQQIRQRRFEASLDKPVATEAEFLDDPSGAYKKLKDELHRLKSGLGTNDKSQAYVDAKGKKLQAQLQRVLDANVPVHGAPDDIIAERIRLAELAKQKKKLKGQRIRSAAAKRREKIRELAIAQGSNPEIEKGKKGFIRSKVLAGQDPIYIQRDSKYYSVGANDKLGKSLDSDMLLDVDQLETPIMYENHFGEMVPQPPYIERYPEGTQLTKAEIALHNAAEAQSKQVRWSRRERQFRAAEHRSSPESSMSELMENELRYRAGRIRKAAARAQSPVPWERPIDTTEVIPPTRYVTKGAPPTRAERAIFDKWWEKVKEINTIEAPKRKGRQAKVGTFDLDKQPVNPRWDPRRVGREEAIRNFINDIAYQTREDLGLRHRPRKGDVGRPIGGKLRERVTTPPEEDYFGITYSYRGAHRQGKQIVPDGNTARRSKLSQEYGSLPMGEGRLGDFHGDVQIAKHYNEERLATARRDRIRRRINTLNYEKEFVDLDPNNRYNRNRLFAEIYGFDDENRLGGGLLKTDNAAGKESIRRQFQDVKDRRGHGDTRYRPRKDDRIRKAVAKLKQDPAVALQNQTRIPSTRKQPRGSTLITKDSPRTIPTAPTILDRAVKTLEQSRPSRRRRRRIRRRSQ